MTAAELRARIEAVREARAGIVRTRVVGVSEFDRLVAQGIAIVAERALCDALLEDADVLAAVEAIGALGEARAAERAADTAFEREMNPKTLDRARRAADEAECDVYTLADRIHAAKGEP